MKKKGVIIFLFVIIIVAAIITVKAFLPRPITDSGVLEVILVEANTNYGQEGSKLEYVHFIPDRISECISKYREQRTLIRHKGYAMENVFVRIMIRTKEGVKDIIIGKDTYTQKGFGPAYRILDEQKFKEEIFDVCGYVVPGND